jgi:predicted metal-dependent enzyme (double-stranded beta helix superfamily)
MQVEARATAERSPLVSLADQIAVACAGPMDALQDDVVAALRTWTCEPRFLSPEQVASRADGYARHLLHADPSGRFAIVSIVWRPGQCTPIHAHYTWCGYAVVAGSLHEERYEWTCALRAVRSAGCADRSAGYACFGHAGVDAVHRLGNRSRAEAVSVHVYGVDAPRVATHVNRVVVAI